MRTLSPPLSLIEAHLFAPSDELIQRWIADDPAFSPNTLAALNADPLARERRASWETPPEPARSPDPSATTVEPPAWLQEVIKQTMAARKAAFSPVPTAGQILRVNEAIGPDGSLQYDQPHPLAVLLDRPTEHRRIWYGWLVSAETDYASDADLILEAEAVDGLRDPLAGLVQLWNPVYVYLPSTQGVLAQLPPDRLAAARALALEMLTEPPSPTLRPEPGVLVERYTRQGHRVLTGTPLGEPDDPRRHYRTLYRAAADLLREPVRLAQMQPTLVERLLEKWRSMAETIHLGLTPAPATAMGETTSVIQHLGDWLELDLQELPEDIDLLTLRVCNLQAAPCRIQVIRQNTVYQEHSLTGHQETRLLIEAVPGTELALLDEHGERLRWPLAA